MTYLLMLTKVIFLDKTYFMNCINGSEFFTEFVPSSIEDAMKWINEQLAPEEVFDYEKLCKWAEENGFNRDLGYEC